MKNLHRASSSRARAAAALVAVAGAALLAGCVAPPPVAPQPVYAPQRHAEPGPMYFYPERGQTEATQERDRYECYRWAVRETGFDPGMTTVRQPRMAEGPPPQPSGAGVAAGAVGGAVVGAAVSGPRHASENAVIGAIFGATLGAIAEQSNAQAAAQAQARRAEADARARQPMDGFRRAMGACMNGRGYRVG